MQVEMHMARVQNGVEQIRWFEDHLPRNLIYPVYHSMGRISIRGVANMRHFEDRPHKVSTTNIPIAAASTEYVGGPQAINCFRFT